MAMIRSLTLKPPHGFRPPAARALLRAQHPPTATAPRCHPVLPPPPPRHPAPRHTRHMSLFMVTSSLEADDDDLNSFFSISPDPLPSYILLGITIAALLFSILAIFVDTAAGRRRHRVLTHGVASSEAATSTFVRHYQPSEQTNNNSQSQSTSNSNSAPQPQPQPQPNNTPPASSNNDSQNDNDNNNSSSNNNPSDSPPDNTQTRSNITPTDDSPDDSPDEIPDVDPEAASADPEVSTSLKDEDDKGKKKNDKKSKQQRQQRKRPKGQLRAIITTILARLLFCAIILGAAALSIYLLVNIIRDGPLSVLASNETNRWIEGVMKRSILQYASLSRRPGLANGDITDFGVSSSFYKTDDPLDLLDSWQWILLFVLIVVYILGGVFVRLLKGFIPTANRAVAFFMLVQLIIWVAASLTAAFIFPTKLPLHSSALKSSWLGRHYVDNLNMTDEHRLLANFYISTILNADTEEGDDIQDQRHETLNVDDLVNFQFPFCTQFTELTPTSVDRYQPSPDELFSTAEPSPDAEDDSSSIRIETETETNDEERIIASSSVQSIQQDEVEISSRDSIVDTSSIPPPESITVEPLPLDLYNELFLVYVVGKPKGTDHYRALAYLALPMMVMGPVIAAQALRKIWLIVFALIWVGLVTVVAVFGTSSILRPIMVPDAGKQLIQFCRLNYRLRIVDDWTMIIAKLDMAMFVMTVVITILEIFRWFKESDYVSSRRRFPKQSVTFDDVNSNNRNNRNTTW